MESKSHSYLLEWAASFVKNKDVVAKKIEKIEYDKNGFDIYVKYKDKEHFFIIAPNLEDIDSIIRKININLHFSIVTLNSRNNFDIFLNSWNKLVNFKLLSIIFANPFSETDRKWIIFPYTHHRICDESSLKTGLRSMFDMVEQIDEAKLLEKIG